MRVSGKGQVDGDGFPRQEAAIRSLRSHATRLKQCSEKCDNQNASCNPPVVLRGLRIVADRHFAILCVLDQGCHNVFHAWILTPKWVQCYSHVVVLIRFYRTIQGEKNQNLAKR